MFSDRKKKKAMKKLLKAPINSFELNIFKNLLLKL